MDFLVLGPLTVIDGDEELTIGRARERVLLSLLIINVGSSVSDDVLVEELWGDDPPSNPKAALQTATSRLRKAIGSTGARPVIGRVGNGYRLDAAPDQIDACRFSDLVEKARSVDDMESQARLLDEALQLWRGPAHADVRFEAFAQPEIRRLEELRAEASELRIDCNMALGKHRRVIGELESLVAEFPLREGLWSDLMLALYRSGRQTEALRVFQRARVAIADAAGLEPGAELTRLEEAILLRDPSIDATSDWDTLAGTKDPLTNLPLQLSSFIGRERDLGAVADLLAANRLFSLVGPGGGGKSRLAAEFASRNRHSYPGGVFLIPLGSVDRGDQLLDAVLGTFSATITPVATEADLIDLLRRRVALLIFDNCEHVAEASATIATSLLGHAPSIRVLTTSRQRLGLPAEQVWQVRTLPVPPPYPSSPADRHAAVDLFLDRARAVRPDIAVDDDETLHAAQQIASALDGLPLAIELAASQCFTLDPTAIASQLAGQIALPPSRDPLAEPKHRTLEAAVNWSLQHLPDHERGAFYALSIVQASFGLDATEAICKPLLLPGTSAIGLLSDLAEQSLIERTDHDARFRMLRPLRAVAQNGLEESGDLEATQRRYVTWLAELTSGWFEELSSPRTPEIMKRFDLELWNIVGAIEWALRNEPQLALPLLAGPRHLWLAHGMGWTAIRSLRCALDLDPKRDLSRINALNTLSFLVSVSEHRRPISRQTVRFDMPAVAFEPGAEHAPDLVDLDPLELAQEAIDISIELEDNVNIAYSRFMQGYAYAPRSEYEAAAAEVLVKGALDTIFESHHTWQRASMEGELSRIKLLQGDARGAKEYARASLETSREMDDVPGLIIALDLLARVARSESNNAAGVDFYREALRLTESVALPPAITARLRIELGYLLMNGADQEAAATEFAKALVEARRHGRHRMVAAVRLAQAQLAVVAQDHTTAIAYLNEAREIAEDGGDAIATAYILGVEGVALCLMNDLTPAADRFRRSLLAQGSGFDRVAVARALEGFAYIAGRQDKHRDAAVLLGAAEKQRLAARTPRERFDDLLENPIAGQTELDSALVEGRGLDTEAAIAFALSR